MVKIIPVGSPRAVAFDSDNGDLYVANGTPTVSVIDGSTNTVVNVIDVGQSPQGLAFDPDNGNMYVANFASHTVSVIDGSTNTVVKNIDVGSISNPFGVAFNSDNGYMYVTNQVSNTVSVIDGSTNTVIKTIPVDRIPFGIAFNAANHNMYVTNAGSDTVSVIDGSTNTVVESIPIGNLANPRGIAFNPNNNDMYVANGGFSTVSVIATTTPIQTTISSATDSNGNPVQDGSSTSSNQITFQFTASGGIPPITFECNLDNSPFSSCSNPQTYSNLAAGQHTFKARAVDTQGNKDPTPATFTWTILTPQQGVQNLINTIDNLHLSRGTTTSLEAPLNAAIRQLNRGNDVATCNLLNAFLDQVNQKETNGQLTSQQAADLRQQATLIQNSLGCWSTSSSLNEIVLPH